MPEVGHSQRQENLANMSTRIGLIHALLESIAPIEAAFASAWADAELIHLYDSSLYIDFHRAHQVTPDITRRVAALIHQSASSGAAGLLFTGSLFSESVTSVRAQVSIPVLTAYEALIEAALAAGSRLVLLATVSDTIGMVEQDLAAYADLHQVSYTLESRWVRGALTALQSGNRQQHDDLIARAAAEFESCDALILAQHSMALASQKIPHTPGRKVLTSSQTAAVRLKELVA